ncbi:hypothetical protein LF1_40670 [Rubripirellula obstinata]|uniref:Uncharacterized protein n=1 Tax=Rubripirellula obstinata TaxID=406547 RepID=A0A5B1CK00_9BACT|nr:hypothetical protein [Rubripirellula obstinata]KAA1261517.1 hypothetical protein LF1_40670 [Rubripirellula obstinata]
MTTSSENQTPVKNRPCGDHWFEMTATLSAQETAQFGDWMSESLDELEASLQHFSSPQSRGEAVARR